MHGERSSGPRSVGERGVTRWRRLCRAADPAWAERVPVTPDRVRRGRPGTRRHPRAEHRAVMPENSFDARADLEVGGRSYEIYRLDALQSRFDVARLPFSLKVLLENLLRNEDGVAVRREDVEDAGELGRTEPAEIAFTPARVVMQDFTGVPAVVDLAAMRDAMADLGGDADKINPLVPAELVIDHSVQVDVFGTRDAFRDQRRARVRAQPGALRVPALGPGRLRGLQGRAARHRHRAPGQPRVPGPRGVRQRGDAVSGHAGRHRLAHDDDQRPRRARLGRRRDRGRGGDARPADVDADPARGRLQARRRAARRAPPRPTWCSPSRRCCASTAWSASSSSSTGPACRTCRSPTAPRSAT